MQISDETVQAALDAWGRAILSGEGRATMIDVMRATLEAVWPDPALTSQEAMALWVVGSHGADTFPFTPEEFAAWQTARVKLWKRCSSA